MKKNDFEVNELTQLSSTQLIESILHMNAQTLDHIIENQLLLELVHNYVELSKELEKKVDEVERLSVTDSLTQIYNRHKFNQSLSQEIKRFERYKESFTVLLFDIDYFKRVNDTYGHDIGDKTLVQFASIISESLRQNDVFARWGGEEFIALIVESDLNNALVLAERIRKKIEISIFDTVKHITVSIGVSSIHDFDTTHLLIQRADSGLYKAKHLGRNQVCTIENTQKD